LQAGVDFVLFKGVDQIKRQEALLVKMFIEGLKSMPGIILYGHDSVDQRTPVVSFNIEGTDPAVIALQLDERFKIMARSGIHCAPSAHKTIGTYPHGTVRFSFSYFNTEEQIIKALDVLNKISKRRT